MQLPVQASIVFYFCSEEKGKIIRERSVFLSFFSSGMKSNRICRAGHAMEELCYIYIQDSLESNRVN